MLWQWINHNNYYVTGYTTSISEFPTNNIFGATYRSNPAGSGDMFITRLNSGMTAFQASTYFGGNSYDEGHALAVICNTNGTNIILAGTTRQAISPQPLTLTTQIPAELMTAA